jgi:hypothetical protein
MLSKELHRLYHDFFLISYGDNFYSFKIAEKPYALKGGSGVGGGREREREKVFSDQDLWDFELNIERRIQCRKDKSIPSPLIHYAIIFIHESF